MYGLVLMTALATGSGTPSYGDGAGCFGGGCCSSSCTGAVVASGCTGTSCYSSGCYSSCSGCCGGALFPLFPRVRAAVSNRMSHAFFGGCSGSSCSGSCYGSSCYGSSCFGSSSYGSSFGPASFGPAYYGSDFHGGCTGCTGCFGSTPVWGGAPPQVSIPSQSVEYRAARQSPTASPARLTIEVPADAKLFVDGQLAKGEGASRNFHTPELPIDQTFFYDLKAEVVVDGKVVTETKRVLVRSGEALSESFPKLLAAVKNADDNAVVTKR